MAMKARGWLAAAGAAALLACVLLAGRSAPASLLGDPEGLEYGGAATGYQAYDTGFEGPPGRWASPDPWINDADDFSQKYGREDGVLDESFSNPQRSLAAGDGSSFEWPYVWEGKAATGDLSGYNWEGAATAASVRGLRMPPSHDVFGELGPFPEEMNLRPGAEHDEVVRMGSLPGGAFFSSMRNSDVPTRANTRRTAERTQSRKTLTPARSGVYAKADQVRGRVGMRQAAVRTSALANKYTDYMMNGKGMSCTCDSAAAGDEEMEGMDKKVKPACVCTGGAHTASGTEQGGPLDTGFKGAWPQNLQNPPKGGWGPQGPYVSYIDGLSSPAYKAPTEQLAMVPRRVNIAALRRKLIAARGPGAFDFLRTLATRGLQSGLRARRAAMRA